MTLRTLVLKHILSFGLHVITGFTADLDGAWLQDPLALLDANATLEGQEHRGSRISGEQVAVQSTPAGHDYWNRVAECQADNMHFLSGVTAGAYSLSKYTVQECVNNEAINLLKRNALGFAVHILPATYFPDGLSYFTSFESAWQGVVPYGVHNFKSAASLSNWSNRIEF